MKLKSLCQFTLLFVAPLAGCTTYSTEYVVRNPGRTVLVMKDSQFVLSRGAEHLPLQEFIADDAKAAGFFACSSRAATAAAGSSSDFRSALSMQGMFIGIIPAFLIRMYFLDAEAQLVDAINISNDTRACSKGL